jgi:hypothetical protein
MYMCTLYIKKNIRQISALLDFKYGSQGAILENQLSPITPELMAGYSRGLVVPRPPGVPRLRGGTLVHIVQIY